MASLALAHCWSSGPSSAFIIQRPGPIFVFSPTSSHSHRRISSFQVRHSIANADCLVPTLTQDIPVQVDQHATQQMEQWIFEIKRMFQSMSLGEISVSPYDTAWVAMVPALNGSKSPQFPKSLNWIIENQLLDGSWGDKELFLAYDRLFSTIACLVALKTWNIGHCNIQKGVEFIHRNLNQINEEEDDYMPTAFEVVFPTMLDDAKKLEIDLPYDSPTIVKIQKERKRKLNKISMDLVHTYPTTLLHSLEGLHRLVDWKSLLKLQTKDGSFLFSPASTACALKYTGNHRCLKYLNSVLEKFNNAVPSVYPVDLFERMWMVDRLERLGISRYFKTEIKECLNYVYKYWTPRGIAWAKESNVFDVDDTAMGFRLLRLHGYKVSPEVFLPFKRQNEFICFEGQTSQAVTGMHNLYRASQIMFPDESILEEAKNFTKLFLIDKQKGGEVQDKWVISKGLKDEVAYTLKFPWNQSLPRIEARDFINHYGVDDVWIAKSLYRMFNVNNEVFLKLAKADYNLCQSFHQKDLVQVLRWNKECQFDKLIFARQKPIECFFSIAATLFEPEYSLARIVWACCGVLTTIIDDLFDVKGSLEELNGFMHVVNCWDPMEAKDLSKEMQIIFMGLYNTMSMVHQEAFKAHGHDMRNHLRSIWVKYIKSLHTEAKWKFINHCPTLEDYMLNAKESIALGPIIQSTLLFLGEKVSEQDLDLKNYSHILDLVNTIGRINNDIQGFERENGEGNWSCVTIFLKDNPKARELEAIKHFKKLSEDAMKALAVECLQDTSLSRKFKQVHLNMAKILNLFYSETDGYTSINEMSQHVENTLYAPIP